MTPQRPLHMYALHHARLPVSHHDIHLQPVVINSSLNPRATADLLNTLRENRFRAQDILHQLKSLDPTAVSLRKDRRQQITEYCLAVWDRRTLSEDFANGKQRSGHAGSCQMPSPLLPHHVTRAHEDCARLDHIKVELAHVSKMALKEALTPLRDNMRRLQDLAEGMSLKSPALARAKAYVARCEAMFDKPNAFRAGSEKDLRQMPYFMHNVEQCRRTFEKLKPFADAGLPEGKFQWMSQAYMASLESAQNAAIEEDWMEFHNQLAELEAIASQSRHVRAAHLRHT